MGQAAEVMKTSAQHAPQEIDLDVQNLCKSFDRDTPVLRGVSLSIPRGQAVSVIGSNGSGKSTMLRCCMRLIEADSGSINLLGQDMMAARGAALRKPRSRVGFVFQKHNLVPRLSVLSNVLHGALARKQGPRVWFHTLAHSADREEALHCLDLVGLAHLAARRADRLSGGQSQRVAIARAMMQHPEMVIADEPVASLDPNAGAEVMDLFVRVMRDKGLTLIFASHHLEHAIEYSERIIGLRSGIVELDTESKHESIENLSEIYGSAHNK